MLLTAMSLILLALALPMPWFNIATTMNNNSPPPLGPSSTTQSNQFYDNHYFEGGTYSRYSDAAWDYPAMHTLMDRMEVIIILWILGGLALMAAILINATGESLVLSVFTVLIGMIAVALFAGSVGHALSTMDYPDTVGFYGTKSGTTSTDYSWSMDFGPSMGFGVLFLAVMLQTLAASVRTYVAWQELTGQGLWLEEPDGDKPEKTE